MIVPRGAKFFPNQAPLVGMTIPTVAGNLRLGYSPRAKKRGMGLLLPVDPTTPQPKTNRVTIPVRGVGVSRGFGRYRGVGDVINYCDYNPPSIAQKDALTKAGDTWNVIKCASGTTTNPANTGAGFNNPAGAMVGTQPVYTPPATPQYEDCTIYGLESTAAQQCVDRNTAKQTAWENAVAIAQGAFNNKMCAWNGNPQSYCDTIYPPGQPGSMAISTPVPLPQIASGPLTAPPSMSALTKLINGTKGTGAVLNWTGGSKLNVGDSWTVTISGAAPNAVVSVTSIQNGLPPSTSNLGSTDSSGNFSLSGTMSANTVGTWNEQWMVNGQTIGSLAFTVTLPSSGGSGGSTAGGGTPTVPPSTTSQSTGSSSGSGGSVGSVPLLPAGFDLSQIPVWGWAVAGGAVLLLAFGGKH